jgi:hypothetical protein
MSKFEKYEKLFENNPLAGMLIVVFLIFVLSIVLVAPPSLAAAYFEAQSYRKYCDTPVTTWDALFLDLRIDECREKN